MAIRVGFTGNGHDEYSSTNGAGTIRVTLPGVDPAHPPTFDATATDPAGYSCSIGKGAYGESSPGYECSIAGQPTPEGGAQNPTAVVVHLVSQSCYVFPAEDAGERAIVDIWGAPAENGPPDASYAFLYNNSFCNPDAIPPPTTTTTKTTTTKTAAPTCKVPKVTGLTPAKAKAKLKKAKCKVASKMKKAFATKTKKGRISAQAPRAGRKTPRTKAVVLTVSKGPKKKAATTG